MVIQRLPVEFIDLDFPGLSQYLYEMKNETKPHYQNSFKI